MKNYHDFDKEYIGSSDMARLVFCTWNDAVIVHFGKDGPYHAYIVYGTANIGQHYELVHEFNWCWLTIYDDTELTFERHTWNLPTDKQFDTIRVYRAGEMGCIIQFLKMVDIKNLIQEARV